MTTKVSLGLSLFLFGFSLSAWALPDAVRTFSRKAVENSRGREVGKSEYNPFVARHERMPVYLGVEFNQAIPTHNHANPSTLYMTRVNFDLMPPALQDYGVLGIGPTFGYVAMRNPGGRSLIFGLRTHYQFRYSLNQFVVPVIALNTEWWDYRYHAQDTGMFFAYGPTAGIRVLLNRLDPSTAKKGFTDVGLKRTYLSAELQMLDGGNGSQGVRTRTALFSLRFEF